MGVRHRAAGWACSAAVIGLSLLGARSAWAGGMWLYETGATDVGTASAGRAALADDASTAFGNPAGMTRLDRSQFQLGLQPLVVTTEFDIGSQTTNSGTDGGNAGGLVPAGGVYAVYSVLPDLKLGVSFNSYAGGSLDYESNWVGRYYSTEAELLTFTLNPVIAYRILPWWSVGAGFSVQWAKLDQEVAINDVLDGSDALLKYKDTNFGFGGNIGTLFEVDPRTRVGLTYRSQVDQSFDDAPSFAQLGPRLQRLFERAGVIGRKIGIDMTIPQEVMLSVYRDVTDDLALMANFNWQNWSQFGEFNLTVDSTPPRAKSVSANFSDTFQGAIGARYRLGEPTVLQVGFAYDSSAVGKANRTPSLPVDQQFRLAAGVQYDVTPDYTLGFAYEWASLGSAPINQTRSQLAGTLEGDYQTNTLNVFNLTLVKRF